MQSSSPAVRSSLPLVVLAFATIYVVWGSTYLGIRWAVETIPPFVMGGTRFVLAGLLLHAFLRWRGRARPSGAQVRDGVVTGLLLLLGGNGLVNWAEQSIPSGITALIVGTTPLWFAFFEWVFPGGNRPSVATIAGMRLGTAGIGLLCWRGDLSGEVRPLGVAAILVAGACWAAGSLYSRRATSGADPFMASSLQMIGGGVAQLVVATLGGEWGRLDFDAVTVRSGLSWLYLVVVGSLVAFSAYVWLLRASTPSRVSTYAYVNPVIAVFLGWLLAGETVSARTLVAAGVIVVAVVIITRAKAAKG